MTLMTNLSIPRNLDTTHTMVVRAICVREEVGSLLRHRSVTESRSICILGESLFGFSYSAILKQFLQR